MDDGKDSYPGFGFATGYAALNNKKIPLDGAVFIRAMLAWVASCPAPASEAAAIYIMQSDKQLRLINGDAEHSLYANSRRRLILADRQFGADGQPQSQNMLLPRQLYRLGQLLTCFKYRTPGTLMEASADNRHHQLHFSPFEFIAGRLGLRLSGSAYSLLETDLAMLATTMVHYQERSAAGQWKTQHSYPLVQRFDTGRVHCHAGRISSSPNQRRKQYWNIELGQPLVAMLNSSTQELTVVQPAAWQAPGKNQTAQWLTLFAESHGYDGRSVFDHNIATLLQRTRLTQRQAGALVGKLTRRTQHTTPPTKPVNYDLFGSSDTTPQKPSDSSTLLDTVKQHGATLRSGARRISAAVQRLSKDGLYQRCEVVFSGSVPTAPSRQHMTGTLLNKFRLSHWPAVLQQGLQALSASTRKKVSRVLGAVTPTWLVDNSHAFAALLSPSLPVFQLLQSLRHHHQLRTIHHLTPC